MNLLTPKVLQGYASIAGLTTDLTQAVKFQLNSFIEEQASHGDVGVVFPVFVPSPPTGNSPNLESNSAKGQTDFSTNNQEEGVDESDFVKSDGRFAYAAYGDIVVIWNAQTGQFVANYTLPPIEQVSEQKIPSVKFSRPIFYQPKPIILGMSLAASRLVLYVQGYGDAIRSDRDYASAFSNAYDTRVIILDTSTLPASIDVVSQEDIQGSFRDARSIGSDVHVVTTSYIDYFPITEKLYRWNPEYQDLNSTQYKAKAVSIAEPLIDDFVATLLSDILLNGKAPAIPKISIWQSDLGKNTNIVRQLYRGGAIQAYVQLTSFSVEGLTGNATLSTAGAFTPSSWGYTYAVDGNLVFAAQGWNWSPWWQGSSQTTYLMGFKLNGASAAPSYLGSIDGYILNQYSLSVFEGHLRVAAIVDTFWPVWEPFVDSSNVTVPPQPVSRTNNSVHVLKIPTGNETALTPVTGIPNLGKPDERFTAVRFFGNICYTGRSSKSSLTPGRSNLSWTIHSAYSC
jgi:DNA excision repair protein ERCC-4